MPDDVDEIETEATGRGDVSSTSEGAHANMSRKSAGQRKPCAPCRGLGTVANPDDHTTPRECGTCHGRGYTWTRTDSVPDGTRKDRQG